MDYRKEYERWCQLVADEDLKAELVGMNDATVEDAFYRDLAIEKLIKEDIDKKM